MAGLPAGTSRRGSLIRRGRGTIAQAAFPKLACLRTANRPRAHRSGERIRDKIAASKKKGMSMGGNVPLGYDVKDRKLIVSEPGASTVRLIFRRYAELGSVALLKTDRLGIVSKRREGAGGRLTG